MSYGLRYAHVPLVIFIPAAIVLYLSAVRLLAELLSSGKPPAKPRTSTVSRSSALRDKSYGNGSTRQASTKLESRS